RLLDRHAESDADAICERPERGAAKMAFADVGIGARSEVDPLRDRKQRRVDAIVVAARIPDRENRGIIEIANGRTEREDVLQIGLSDYAEVWFREIAELRVEAIGRVARPRRRIRAIE